MISTQLKTFVSVADKGSFSKAADSLFISSTAVMKQIDCLEKRLNMKLLIRSNQGLKLTDAGESIYQDAKYLMDYTTRAIEKAKNIALEENRLTIRIGTSVMTPAKFILDIWNDIHKKIPNLNIELIPFENTKANAKEILYNLGSQIDIVAGLYDENFKKMYNLNVVPLKQQKIALAVPFTHPLANNDIITYQVLNDSKLMMIHEGWNYYIDQIRSKLTKEKIEIIDFDFFNLSAFNLAVKNNIPIIAGSGFENVHPLLKIIPIDTPITIPYGIIYANNPSKNVKCFIDKVKEIF